MPGAINLTEADVTAFIEKLELWGDELPPAEQACLGAIIVAATAAARSSEVEGFATNIWSVVDQENPASRRPSSGPGEFALGGGPGGGVTEVINTVLDNATWPLEKANDWLTGGIQALGL